MSERNQDDALPLDWLRNTYPEAGDLFATWLRSVEQIKKRCLVVLDTNVLLTPYTIGPKSLDQIRNTYEHLIKAGRLRIPGQIAREFVKNRASKLEELFQQLTRKRTNLPPLASGRYPLLEPIEQYEAVLKVEQELADKHKEYSQALQKLLEHVRSWTWNDPVSSLYGDLFDSSIVVDPDHEDEVLEHELARRVENRIPPGYKDAGKPDSGVGDLLIWLTILELGRTEKKDLLFVSGDEKSDWWHRSEGQALYPRFELAEEYRRISGGKSFQIVRFSTFLDLLGVEATVVEEVRKEEVEARSLARQSFARLRHDTQVAEEAVAEWAKRRFEALELIRGRANAPDILIRDSDGDLIGIEVVRFRGSNHIRNLHRLRDVAYRGHWQREQYGLTVFAGVLAADDPDSADKLVRLVRPNRLNLPPIHLHIGFMTGEGDFVEIEEVRL